MRTIAICALLAAPALTKALAQAKDDAYAEPTYEKVDYVAEAPAYKDDAYSDHSYGKRSHKSYSDSDSGSNYSVSDHDQYHNNEDNNQSPYVDYADDTTT